jgi:arylsulfatase A-like enzyme/tetratricopeptide (TPR) repeat protein
MGKKKKKDHLRKEASQHKSLGRSRGNISKLILAIVSVCVVGGSILLFFLKQSRNASPPTTGKYKGYNILLVTLDTTRADHLPAYGYTQVKTPNLDRLADQSFIFQDAISHTPMTLPSHASMMTGKLPITHGIRDNAGYILDPSEITLAEILKQNGYTTAAFVSTFVLDSRWHLDQGFDVYFDNFNLALFKGLNPREAQRPASETEIEVEPWLQTNHNKPFFLWVHFYDPHEPYDPPEPYKTEYADHLYDGEIAYTDEILGKLQKKIDNLKIDDRTIVVVAGDHGEGLGEHKEATHAMFVYNTTLHVPLLIRIPGARKQRIEGVVRLIDLAPTVLDLLGINSPSEMSGTSLIPRMNATEKIKRVAYSESLYSELHYGWSSLISITTDQYKYIQAPRPELYDLKEDSGELVNLIYDKPHIAKALHNQIEEIVSTYSRKDQKSVSRMDMETEEKLRALGYITGSVESTPESRQVDPKDKIEVAQAIQQASYAQSQKDYETASRLITPVLEQDPGIMDAHLIAALSYIGLRQYDSGIDELMKTLALNPNHSVALYNLGYAYELKGNLKEAAIWYHKVLEHEEKLFATLKLAHIYRKLNQPEQARFYFLQTVQDYEDYMKATKGDAARSALHVSLGEIYFGAGELDQAEKHFQAAIKLTPTKSTLHYNLAQIYEAKGNFQEAIWEYQKEVEVDPSDFKAFNDLGLLYSKSGRWEDAATCFRKVMELAPRNLRGYILLASTYEKLGKKQEANEILQKAEEIKLAQKKAS